MYGCCVILFLRHSAFPLFKLFMRHYVIGKKEENHGFLMQVGISGCHVAIVLLLVGGPKKCTLNVFDRGENFGMLLQTNFAFVMCVCCSYQPRWLLVSVSGATSLGGLSFFSRSWCR